MICNVFFGDNLSVISCFFVLIIYFIISIFMLAYHSYDNVTWYWELISCSMASFYLVMIYLELKRLSVYSEFVTCLPEYFHTFYFSYTHHLIAKFYYEGKWEEWYGNQKKYNKKPGQSKD